MHSNALDTLRDAPEKKQGNALEKKCQVMLWRRSAEQRIA